METSGFLLPFSLDRLLSGPPSLSPSARGSICLSLCLSRCRPSLSSLCLFSRRACHSSALRFPSKTRPDSGTPTTTAQTDSSDRWIDSFSERQKEIRYNLLRRRHRSPASEWQIDGEAWSKYTRQTLLGAEVSLQAGLRLEGKNRRSTSRLSPGGGRISRRNSTHPLSAPCLVRSTFRRSTQHTFTPADVFPAHLFCSLSLLHKVDSLSCVSFYFCFFLSSASPVRRQKLVRSVCFRLLL